MAQKGRKSTSFYRGDAGRQKAEEELARQKARQEARKDQTNQPFRFRVGVGETTQFVILDEAPDFYRFEHNMKNPQTGFWDTFTGCVKEFDNCPVCEATGKDSYYALYFSVIDFTEFKTRDGVKHEFSRKLLVVKPAQQKKFIRAFNKAEKDGRTLRGAVFEVTRDGEKDSSIGNDIEFIEYMEEDELEGYVRSWKDKDGKKHTENCSEPYDYEEMFEEPDADKLRALVGAEPPAGSREANRRAVGGSSRGRSRDSEDDDEDGEYEKADRKERMKPSSRRGRNEDADEEDEEEEQPRRSARSRSAAPEKPASRGRGRSTEDDEDEDEEEDERPKPSSRGRTATRGRAKEEVYDEEDEEEEEAPRRAPGAGRRVKPRGR